MEVVLTIPADRPETKRWITHQSPEVVADIFDVAKEMFNFTASMASVQQSENVARMAQQHLRSSVEKDTKIGELSAEVETLRRSVESINATVESKAVEISKRQMVSNEELHRTQMDELMRTQHEMVLKSQQQMTASYDNTIMRYEQEIGRLKSEMQLVKSSERSMNSHMSDVLRESTSVLKQFTKDVSTGFTGEELVRAVFDETINTGYLEDTSRSTEPGSEDYLWKTDEVTASVEVKFKANIHSVHDMQKHRERIYEAARMKKINIGIFLSLKCRIPNKPLMCVETVSGIPVVYAALGAGMSPKQVVHHAFVLAGALARRVGLEEHADSNLVIDQVVSLFDKFVKSLNKQQDLIHSMRRQVNQNFRCLEALEKIKAELISGIEGLRTDHPCLCPATDDTDSSDGTDQVQTILEYVEKHRRYPTHVSQLPEGAVACQSELDDLVKHAKREKKRRL